jgi:stringent starvation protein B
MWRMAHSVSLFNLVPIARTLNDHLHDVKSTFHQNVELNPTGFNVPSEYLKVTIVLILNFMSADASGRVVTSCILYLNAAR